MRPPRPAFVDDLPDDGALWAGLLRSVGEFGRVREVAGVGFELTDTEDGTVITVRVTPSQWRAEVVACERTAREDTGEDAFRRGQGSGLAMPYLEEAMFAVGWDDDGDRLVEYRRESSWDVTRSGRRPDAPPPDGDWFANDPTRRER